MKKKAVKNLFKKNRHYLMIFSLALVFFVFASAFNFYTQDPGFVKWASPDESANYIFAKLYGQEEKLSMSESYNIYVEDIMRPRSIRSDNGELKPMSFLGIIIIYGTIARFFSHQILPFLTPVFAAAGLFFFYLLVRRLFGKTNALASVFFLASFPPYIYYSARSMFHNVLFLTLFLAGLYFLIISQEKQKNPAGFWSFKPAKQDWRGILYSSFSGVLTGFAAVTRTSELLWMAPLFFLLFIFYFRRLSLLRVAVFAAFFCLAATPVLYYNQILYGSYFFGGYNEMNRSIINITNAGTAGIKSFITGAESARESGFGDTLKSSVFHFGIHPSHSMRMFAEYFLKMFYYLFWPALLGFLWFFSNIRKVKAKHSVYAFLWLSVSAVLILFYGSWEFHDNPDPEKFTIGNSYTRYWLPAYLGAIPFFSHALIRLSWLLGSVLKLPLKLGWKEKFLFHKKISRKFFANAARTGALALAAFISINFVLIGSDEGLVQTAYRQRYSKSEWQKILSLTEENAAIITLYHDKLLFPERKVIVGLFNDPNMNRQYAKLADKLPLYYYNFTLPPKDFAYLNSRRLKESGLKIEKISPVTPDFSLYKISKSREAGGQEN